MAAARRAAATPAPPDWVWRRRNTARAFSLCRETESRWACWSATSAASSPVASATRLARTPKALRASRPHPPPWASTTMGRKVKPCAAQSRAVSWCCLLNSSYRSVAALDEAADAARRSARNPDVAAKSQAAAVPLRYRGRDIDVGRAAAFVVHLGPALLAPGGGLPGGARG